MSKMSIEPGAVVRRTLNGPTMGTRYSVIFYAPAALETSALSTALAAAVARVDQQMSTWMAGSDLNRLNAAPVGHWVAVPPELMRVLVSSLEVERRSAGAFDIGVGDRVAAWGFGARAASSGLPPADDTPPGMTHLALDLDVANGKVCKRRPLSLDLSGIAKGFGVDEMADVMMRFGITAWLVGIDGEMRAGACKPDGTEWAVAHEAPTPGARQAMGVIELSGQAVATSGTYRHFREVAGHTVSHTIDPCRGAPVSHSLVSVTVIAPTCMEADAWATALMVSGETAALDLARVNRLGVIFVREDGDVISNI
jgi:FAD:protein FMN transferase